MRILQTVGDLLERFGERQLLAFKSAGDRIREVLGSVACQQCHEQEHASKLPDSLLGDDCA